MPRITIHVPGLTSQPYHIELDRPLITLGRGNDNDVVIASSSVSTHHAELKRTASGYELHDVGSTNGIMADEVRHMILSLDKDCTVYLGDASMHFLLSDEELATLGEKKSAVAPSPHRAASGNCSSRIISRVNARPCCGHDHRIAFCRTGIFCRSGASPPKRNRSLTDSRHHDETRERSVRALIGKFLKPG